MTLDDIAYTIRHSSRAKRISLRIDRDNGLEIVLPKGCRDEQGLQFLHERQHWVLRHYQQPDYQLISKIDLVCLDKQIAVRYLPTDTKHVRLSQPLDDVLIFSGPIRDRRCCQAKLDRWLKSTAQAYLLPLLKTLSEETGLIYRHASVRLQRSRWGSCSANGDISLNARLLYKPYQAVRYVLIHELCHLRELNHSAKFWRLVAKYEPEYEACIAMLA